VTHFEPTEPPSPKSKKRRVNSDDDEEDGVPGKLDVLIMLLPVSKPSQDSAPRSSPPAKLKSKLKDITLEGSHALRNCTPVGTLN
jgi:hypothetical protein